jgi:hypothetical protein
LFGVPEIGAYPWVFIYSSRPELRRRSLSNRENERRDEIVLQLQPLVGIPPMIDMQEWLLPMDEECPPDQEELAQEGIC